MKLTRLADVKFFESKRNDREVVIQKGMFVEELESKGITVENLKDDAKKVLELDEDGSITAEWEDILKRQNIEAQAFISVVNSISKLEATGAVSSEDVKILRNSEEKLAKKLAERYGVDVERLYEEVNLGEEDNE